MSTRDIRRAASGPFAASILLLAWIAVCTQAAQAAISMSAPRALPILTRIEPRASLAVLENGSFAIAGVEVFEDSHGQSLSRILVQFFEADGTSKGDPVVVVTSDQGCYGGVGSLGDHYFVTWQLFEQKQTSAAFYDQEGRLSGAPFPLPNSEVNYYSDFYRYGPGPSRRIVARYYHKMGEGGGDLDFQPMLQVFDGQARALGPPFVLGPPRRRVRVQDLAINGNGRLIVLEDQCPLVFSNPPQQCLRGVQVFDKGGRPRTGLLTKDIEQNLADRGQNNSFGAVAMDANGNFLLLWIYDVFGSTQHLVARIYDREGHPLSGVLPVRDGSTLSFRRPLALSNGDFLIPSLVYSPAYPNGSLYLQELWTSNHRLLPSLFVANEINAFLLEANSSGHGIVAWSTLDAQGHTSGAFFSLLTVTGRPAAPEDDGTPAVDESGRNEP